MASTGMQLYLVNNNPISTLLVTSDGLPLFSIQTPSSSTPEPTKISSPSGSDTTSNSIPALPGQDSPSTTILRLGSRVEATIGVVDYCGPSIGTNVKLLEDNLEICVAPYRQAITSSEHEGEESQPADCSETWSFIGPSSLPYKWQFFCQSPVMIVGNACFATPLARYRRAKLGIVSRSRRAFLEIFPGGLEIIDFIVVTFVGFMRQRFIYDHGQILSVPSIASVFEHYAQTTRALESTTLDASSLGQPSPTPISADSEPNE